MESPIEIIANSKQELNSLIDEKLKKGYLLQGGMQTKDKRAFVQIMILPNNIDGEVTLASAIKFFIFLIVMVALNYMIITSF